MALRSPIVSVLGHVDHGKSSILDAVRGSNITAKEAGKITQAIGASIVPLEVIQRQAGKLMESMKMDFTIPGLLFIDTPGHAAFTSLRKRGGNLADIAVVVIDLNDGFKPQTIEAIEILRQYRTPFVVAANKVDLVPGYRKQSDFILQDIRKQAPEWQKTFEERMYALVGQLHEHFAINAERFDRVDDFTKKVAIVPTSASAKQGIRELLMVLAGLAQRYLEENLNLNVEGPGKGTVLEVKETKGFGTTADVILYDGTIRKNDTIVIGGTDEPVVTSVRALLEPNPLQETRDEKSKYVRLDEATAATGLRIAAPNMDGVVAGMPLRVATGDNIEAIKAGIQQEVRTVLLETEKEGIIIKADSLGGLEAVSTMLREKDIPIRKAAVGKITKRDIAEAEANYDAAPVHAVVLGFNVPEAASTEQAKVITSPIIYDLLDKLEEWRAEVKEREEAAHLDLLVSPCKIEVLQNCIFRQSNPCVAGVEILAGTLKVGTPLMDRAGKRLTLVRSIQKEKQSVQEARFGEQVAVSLPDVTAGRQIHEHDVIYSAIPEEQFRQFKEHASLLGEREKAVLKEIASIMREENPLWGV